MPSILSKHLSAKILGSEWSFGYNCYEVGHTWTPNCTDAALEISSSAFFNILPLYAMLYTFSQVAVQRKYDLPASWETIKSIVRSSSFIFFHAYNGSIMGCALRHSFGRFYYRVLVCFPALISSYLALLIEKPARRQALAFYMLNLASEIVYRMAVTKGYLKPVRYGETLLFALSLSAWYHLIRLHGFGHDPVSGVVKVLIGREEAKSRSRSNRNQILSQTHDEQVAELQPASNSLEQRRSFVDILIQRLLPEENARRHPSCPHQTDFSCIAYVLNPIPSRFLIGYSIQTLLKLSANPIRLYNAPIATLRKALTSSASVRFGIFLSSLVSCGRLTSCLLRHYSNSNSPAWHGAASGFIAGLSMLWAPRSSLSMYIMWKAVEQYYLLAHRQNKVRYFEFTILNIYAFSAATILYSFALEPKFVRPSYMKFLDGLSNHRLHQLNRMVLDVFGTGSSVGYEDYFPDLDPKLMSNQFKELIFNWMIQPFENSRDKMMDSIGISFSREELQRFISEV